TPLRNAGLIKSIRGAYGGYLLTKPAEKITAGDVIRVLEGPITPVEGIEDEDPAKQALWMRVRDAVKDVLDTTTLKDLVDHDHTEKQEAYMFYIKCVEKKGQTIYGTHLFRPRSNDTGG